MTKKHCSYLSASKYFLSRIGKGYNEVDSGAIAYKCKKSGQECYANIRERGYDCSDYIKYDGRSARTCEIRNKKSSKLEKKIKK